MKLIPLTQDKFAKVDDWWYDFLNQWKWQFNGRYATRREADTNTTVYMHRVINNTPKSFDTDHEDQNKLNNQKGNLRTSTRTENKRNTKLKTKTSKYKGVNWHTLAKKWRAEINIPKNIYLGLFKGEIEAAKVYDQAALKYFGEFACLNFN